MHFADLPDPRPDVDRSARPRLIAGIVALLLGLAACGEDASDTLVQAPPADVPVADEIVDRDTGADSDNGAGADSGAGTPEPALPVGERPPYDPAAAARVPFPPADAEGPAGFEVQGNIAYMYGVIGTGFDDVVRDLLAGYPDVDTIEMEIVPGSADDEANLRAARLVRKAALTTVVTSQSEISSGGTDFFLAGVRRIVDDGAQIGVHSWAAGDYTATDIPRDDPEHRRYTDYYDELGIDPDFYWFTIDAAPADDMHWMTPTELERYGIATE